MIDDCNVEFRMALNDQDEQGLHLATTLDDEYSYPNTKDHFFMIMVDDNGNEVIE